MKSPGKSVRGLLKLMWVVCSVLCSLILARSALADTYIVNITLDGGFNRTTTSNASGGFSFNLTPGGTIAKGTHTVAASGAGGQTASATF